MSKDVNQNTVPNELNIKVTFRHTESTEALKRYAVEKIAQRVKKYVRAPIDVHVVLAVEKLDHIAEVHINKKGVNSTAKAVTGNLYSAIDKLVDTIETQLRRQKERMVSQRHQVVEAAMI